MVGDQQDSAYIRLISDYNFAGYPSTFFDGGDEVLVGGYSDLGPYTSRIQSCGQRAVAPLDLRTKVEWLGNDQIQVTVKIGNNISLNTVPDQPSQPAGDTYTSPDVSLTFETSGTDPDSDSIYYQFDWGDGHQSDWLGPYSSGETGQASKSWSFRTTYTVKARSKDTWGEISSWSDGITVTVGCCEGIRGNIDGDQNQVIDISDLLYLVDYMFASPSGPAPNCVIEADVNSDGTLDVSDLLYIVDYMFVMPSGPEPEPCN